MRAYAAILSARFRMLLQYRAAALAGFACQFFWGMMRVMIFDAFYRSTTAPQPMSYAQTVSYIWLGQAFLVMLPWNVEGEIRALIRTRNVAYEMLRPVDLYWLWFTRSFAFRSAPVALRALPMFLTAGLFAGLAAPPSWPAACAFVLSMAGALVLTSAITAVLSITLLWTVSGQGISIAMFAASMIFSGMIVPLPLMPDWAQTALALQPFRGICDAPYRIYAGNIPASGVLGVLAHQLIWTAIIVTLGLALLERGRRRLVVQGG